MRLLTMWAVAASLVLAAAEPVSAQGSPADQHGLELGFKGGVSSTGLEFSGGGDFFENEFGVTAGIYVTRHLFSVLDVTVEALYSRKGATDVVIGNRIVIDYVDVPLLARVATGVGSSADVYGFVGPAVSLRLRARFGEANATDNYERLDVAVVGGGGVSFGRYLVEGRVTWGLRNTAVDLFGPDTITNRSISVLGGFRLR